MRRGARKRTKEKAANEVDRILGNVYYNLGMDLIFDAHVRFKLRWPDEYKS